MNEETRLLHELEDFRPRSLEAAYPAALAPRIDTDPSVAWAVAVPDLPGCIAEGSTQEEAMTNAVEAVETWIAARRDEAAAPVPGPTSIDAWARVPKYAGWTWFLVGTRRLTEADRDEVEAVLDEAADAPLPSPSTGVEVVAAPVPDS